MEHDHKKILMSNLIYHITLIIKIDHNNTYLQIFNFRKELTNEFHILKGIILFIFFI